MKVYIALDCWQEGDTILGVFSTKEKAKRYAEREASNSPYVEQFELDEEYIPNDN